MSFIQVLSGYSPALLLQVQKVRTEVDTRSGSVYSCIEINWKKTEVLVWHLFFVAACLKHAIPSKAEVICTTTVMNVSDKSSHPEEGMLGNSTWNYGPFHQNYTLSPPLIPDKTSTSKPAACEQLHIAIEVWTAYVNTEYHDAYFFG